MLLRGGLGLFWPIGYEYERIQESVSHFGTLLQADYFHSAPFAEWLVPLLYYLLPVFSAFVVAALVVGIVRLKKRQAFGLKQVLLLALPMAVLLGMAFLSVELLPSRVGNLFGWSDWILPVLLALTLLKKRSCVSVLSEKEF